MSPNKILSWFSKPIIIQDKLEYEFDFVNGFHNIRIFRVEKQEKTPIEINEDLFNHGYSRNNEKEKRILSGEDFQILIALKALNPEIIENKILKAKINPSILTYLRDSGKIIETISSKQLRFSSEPLITAVKLQYQPKRGIQIEAGYNIHNSTTLHAPSSIRENEINGYVKIGQTYYVKPNNKNKIVEETLKKEKETIPLKKIPYFIKNNLYNLINSFGRIELNDVEKILIYEDKIKPIINLDVTDKTWIKLRISYKIGETIIPYDVLRDNKEKYLQINNYIWLNVDNIDLKDIENKITPVTEALEWDAITTSIANFPRVAEILKQIDATIEGLKEASNAYFETIKIKETPPTSTTKKPPFPRQEIPTGKKAPPESPKIRQPKPVPDVSKNQIETVIKKFMTAPSRSQREAAENQLLEYSEKAVIYLISTLYDADEENVWKIISILGKIGDVRAIEAFEQIWDKSNEEDKKIIIRALSEIGDAQGYHLLNKTLTENNIVLQIRAKEAKERIDKNYIGN